MRLLVAEDDSAVSTPLVKRLQAEEFIVDLAEDGETGLRLATGTDYSLVILNWSLPRLDGLSVLKRLRNGGRTMRVMLLSGRDDVSERIAGLQAGADDFLTKPYALEELLARVYSLLRRPEEWIDTLKVADLELDRMTHTVKRSGKPIMLTQREYSVLEYLMRNAGCPVTRSMVIEHVWNLQFEGLTNVVDVYVNYLRAKIDRGASRRLIHTARGVGYMLAALN
ncbi:MAG: response regulator transcription factor [Acidobacteriia bacterium]|nr:response regulator transcription factor [Terriglobia bacterium]